MYERTGSFVRITKKEASIMYYSDSIMPLRKGADPRGLEFLGTPKKLLCFYITGEWNGCKHMHFNDFVERYEKELGKGNEIVYWALIHEKEAFDIRQQEYKNLRHNKWSYNKNSIPSYVNIQLIEEAVRLIVKYKPVTLNCLQESNDRCKLKFFLEQFDLEACLDNNNIACFTQALKYIGFK